MKPRSPVIPGQKWDETIYAKHQPEYNPLPSICTAEGIAISRWRLSWRERLRILFRGNLWLHVHTFGQPLQPVLLETTAPEIHLTTDMPPGPPPEPIVTGAKMVG